MSSPHSSQRTSCCQFGEALGQAVHQGTLTLKKRSHCSGALLPPGPNQQTGMGLIVSRQLGMGRNLHFSFFPLLIIPSPLHCPHSCTFIWHKPRSKRCLQPCEECFSNAQPPGAQWLQLSLHLRLQVSSCHMFSSL